MSSKKALFLISLMLFSGFVYFSNLVARETFIGFDFDTTVKLQDHLSRRFDLPFTFFSLIGSVEITSLIWLVLVVYSLLRRFWLTFLAMFLFWAGMAFELFGKLFVYHPAPPHLFYRGVFNFNLPSSYAQTDYSYPSGHLTRTTFLVAFIFCYLLLRNRRINFLPQLALLGFLGLMAVSRIYLGEHWTSDVIGGILLGSSLGTLTSLTIPKRTSACL